MAIITNAGSDDRLSPHARAAAEAESLSQGLMQDAEVQGRLAAARRERVKAGILQLEAQGTIAVGDGEERQEFDRMVVGYQLDEPDYDASIPTLAPYVIEWRETPFWPLGRRVGARGGLRPVLPPKAWDALLDGYYCLRCLRGQHDEPHIAVCPGCDLTAEHRANVLDHLEEVGEAVNIVGPNRHQRRALKRAAKGFTKSGIQLPGQVA